MAKSRNKTLDYLVYVLLRTVAMFVQASPTPVAYRLAKGLGSLAYWVDRRHRRLACEQIQRSFPDWPDAKVRRTAKEAIQSIALLGLEMLITPRMIRPGRFMRHIRFAGIDKMLEYLVRGQSGVIVLTGHFGNWEVSGYAMAALGFPAVAVARPLDNPYVDRFVRGVRERTGLKIVDKKGASTDVDATLNAKGAVCFIADQDAGRKGVFVEFFGRPASTFKTIALMAMRHNVPIVVAYTKRLGNGYEFEVGVERVITPAEWSGADDEVWWITQTYTAALEAVVRRDPGQYFGWAHRRWKNQPRQGRR